MLELGSPLLIVQGRGGGVVLDKYPSQAIPPYSLPFSTSLPLPPLPYRPFPSHPSLPLHVIPFFSLPPLPISNTFLRLPSIPSPFNQSIMHF